MSIYESKKCGRCGVSKEVRIENFKQIGKTDEKLKWSALCKGCLNHKQNKVINNQLENEKYLKEVLSNPKVKEHYKAEIKTARDQEKIKSQETIDKLTKELQKSIHEFTEMNQRHQKAQETITELRKELSSKVDNRLDMIMKHLNVNANSF